MYQSAISTVAEAQYATDHSSRQSRTLSPGDHSRPFDVDSFHLALDEDTASEPDLEPKDEMILSFGVEPIVIRLTTPPVSPSTHDLGEDPSSQPQSAPSPVYNPSLRGNDKPSSVQNLKLTFSAGVLACAFRAWHIRGILDMLDAWGSHHSPSMPAPPTKPSSSSADAIFALGLDASMKMRGVVILLLPLEILGNQHGTTQNMSPDSFFTRPLVPPRLAHGYVRIFLDTLSTSCSLSDSATLTESASSPAQTRAAGIQATSATNVVTIAFALNDLSVFALLFIPKSARSDADLTASPILITDQSLPLQYPIAHVHPISDAKFMDRHNYPQLPDFAILDWTNQVYQINSAKLSTWRTKAKPKASKRRDSQTRLGVAVLPSPSSIASNIEPRGPHTIHGPAVTINASFVLASSAKGQSSGRKLDDHVEIDVVPLHIFLDLGLTLGNDHALVFLDDVISGRTSTTECSPNDGEESDGDEEEDGNSSLQERSKKERETERQRLERLVLEDLDLGLDYRDKQPAKPLGLRGASATSRSPHKVGPTSLYANFLAEIHHFTRSLVDLDLNSS
jgi:autophagy-related protein 2